MKKSLRKLVVGSFLSGSLVAAPALAAPPQPPTPVAQRSAGAQAPARPVLDVVFALDTTGSMGGLLEGAKQKIWSIASRMASGTPTPRVRVGLVAYRDQGDEYVTKVIGLTDDLDAVYAQLQTFAAGGGGDGPEAVQTALAHAVDRMQWSQAPSSAKMIFLVGDAPAHAHDTGALEAAARKAINQGIVVNTIRCGGDPTTATQFTTVARLADGTFDSIAQSGGVVAVATPFDDELAKLNGALMDTAVYAGKKEALARSESGRAERKKLDSFAAADRVGYLAKSAPASAPMGVGSAAGGAFDLATAPEKAATLSDDQLSDDLKAMTPEQRVSFAKGKQAERTRLQGKIVELTKQRDAFLATKTAENKDGFDARVFDSVKRSAAKAGVSY